MNLIDKDALLKIFHRYYGNDLIEVEDVIGWINEQPTIEERKRGHKINQHQYPAKWICSECGAKHFNFDDNFCSNCGARMEGNT